MRSSFVSPVFIFLIGYVGICCCECSIYCVMITFLLVLSCKAALKCSGLHVHMLHTFSGSLLRLQKLVNSSSLHVTGKPSIRYSCLSCASLCSVTYSNSCKNAVFGHFHNLPIYNCVLGQEHALKLFAILF